MGVGNGWGCVGSGGMGVVKCKPRVDANEFGQIKSSSSS